MLLAEILVIPAPFPKKEPLKDPVKDPDRGK